MAARYPLAIFSPRIGVASETFIQRHIEGLLPKRTVVLTRSVLAPGQGTWNVENPVLNLSRLHPGLIQRGVRWSSTMAGLPSPDYAAAAARRFLRQHQVEVLMGEFLDASLVWAGLAKDLGIRFFGHAHGYDVSARLRDPAWRIECLRYNDSDGIITMSHASRNQLIELGLEPSKVHVIPYGVDVPAVPPSHPAQDTVRCLAVGRMVDKKAPIVALDAFRRAGETHPNLRLDFVGAGPLLPAAEQFVQAFQLGSRVTLHGQQRHEDVQRLMRDADVFIQHSMTGHDGNQEGLPVSILEAMAHALPVVSTVHAGIPEAVDDGHSGFLVGEGDSERMADGIVRLARSPDLRRTMGDAGWQRARDRFSWGQEREKLRQTLGV
jgi:colanic acid/amylovoran biosynthesis glycosyltransferase